MMLGDPLPPIDDRDHVRGAATPVVTIVQYGDYECPHTRAAEAVIALFLSENPDIRRVFRHLPLRTIHPRAETLARAAEAAHQQGKFWKLHDALMARATPLDERGVLVLAKTLGIDDAKMKNDMGGRVAIAAVERHMQGGLRCGVHTTPTFFFEGVLHDGTSDEATLREQLDEAWTRATAPKSRLSRI
jgi:protein-disulfide isomerase